MYRRDLKNMSLPDQTSTPSSAVRDASSMRKAWIAPSVTELPKLKNLTLQTGGSVGGNQSVIP